MIFRHQCPHPYHQSARRRVIERNTLVIVVVGLVLFFALGRFSVKNIDNYKAENDFLQTSVDKLTLENKELNKQQDFIENARKIDAQARKDSRRSLTKLNDELSAAREQLIFYQRVVAPETIVKGLYINSFEIKAIGDNGRYVYQLVLVQGASQKRVIKGKYNLSVIGEKEGKEVKLLLKAITLEKVKPTGYSFKYYELLTGEISFPEDFVPQKVNVIVSPSKKGSKTIQKQWSWKDANTASQ